MQTLTRPLARSLATAALAAAMTLAAGCSGESILPIEMATARAVDGLMAQAGGWPALLAPLEAVLTPVDPKAPPRTLVIDPALDTMSGQQTVTTALLDRLVAERMGRKGGRYAVLPFVPASLERAEYLLTATMTRSTADRGRRPYRIQLALVEIRTGTVVAQATSLAREDNLDGTALRYYRDSPILIRDRVSEGYARTAATPRGGKADRHYLERLAAASRIDAANRAYNAERYRDALGQYQEVLRDPAGEQLRVQSGIYLANMKLGRSAEAEQAFGKVVALGVDYNELGVKFLFNAGSTEFWSDPKISGAYGMWLRQIARTVADAGKCMNVVGHTSNSGPAAVNDALSLRRAEVLRQQLVGLAGVLDERTSASGKGFRENLVGSGSDNAFDVLDRRVEFRFVPCGQVPVASR